MRFAIVLGCVFPLICVGCGQVPPKPSATKTAADLKGSGLELHAANAAKANADQAGSSAVTDMESELPPVDPSPATPPASPKGEPINLSGRYTVPIEKLIKSTGFPWRDVPRGTTTLGNVPLEIGGFIALWGASNAQNSQVYPESVVGIQIARKFEALYLYDTSFFSGPEGTPIANVIFQYGDGTSAENEICYGTHVRDWWQNSEKPIELTDPKSKLVWSGANSFAPADRPNQLQLFITEISNPHPELEVATIDLASSKGPAALCIMAMTTGPAGLLKVEETPDQ